MLDIMNNSIQPDDKVVWVYKGKLTVGIVQWVQPKGIVVQYEENDDYAFTMLSRPEEVAIVKQDTQLSSKRYRI